MLRDFSVWLSWNKGEWTESFYLFIQTHRYSFSSVFCNMWLSRGVNRKSEHWTKWTSICLMFSLSLCWNCDDWCTAELCVRIVDHLRKMISPLSTFYSFKFHLNLTLNVLSGCRRLCFYLFLVLKMFIAMTEVALSWGNLIWGYCFEINWKNQHWWNSICGNYVSLEKCFPAIQKHFASLSWSLSSLFFFFLEKGLLFKTNQHLSIKINAVCIPETYVSCLV